MATDILFPFFEILVENIFGGVGIALVAVALLIAVICIICRVSGIFLMYWLFFYAIVMTTMYVGALGMIFGFILITLYTIIALVRLIIFMRT